VSNRVVARFLDGRVVKGASFDVSLQKSVCHVQTGRESVEVRLADLKALFFVKDLTGDASYHEQQGVVPGDPRTIGARRVKVVFRDGEQLFGLLPAYRPDQPFFYVLPVDPRSNNLRVLVNRAATEAVEVL
jgi:hypothetical protein